MPPPRPALPSDRLYQTLLDTIPSSVLLIDPGGRVTSANRNFLAKSRTTTELVVGRPVADVFPPVVARQMQLRERVAEVVRTGLPVKGERLTYRAPGLPTRAYYYSLVPLAADGAVEAVLLLMEDVTEQVRLGEEVRRAERHLASVVESVREAVASTDLGGRVVSWNAAAAALTGFDETDARGRLLVELCPVGHRPALADALARAAADERAAVEGELTTRAGPPVPVDWVCSPMRDEAGRPVGLVAVGRDLTERRRLEARLVRSEKLAALGVMAGGIAHEIRNPLAVVSSAAQLLLAAPLDPETQQECASRIHRNVLRASGVIENLLRFARPSPTADDGRFDLRKPVGDALDLTAHQLRLARAEVTVEVTADPLPVRGNPGLVQQVVMNLLLNAANALPEAGGAISLRVAADGPHALVAVTDTGRGIAADDLPKVFDPFFTTMPVGRGTGLGLSICYAVAQQYGGRIDLTSEPGRGTTAVLRLPLDPAEDGP